MWYLGMTYKEHEAQLVELALPSTGAGEPTTVGAPSDASRGLGKQVYENNCASCHQLSGEGLPGVFPPLKGNAIVTAADPRDHVLIALNGLQGKAIDGISYAAPMPPLGAMLSDEEVAAVVNHERTSWGHNAPLVTPEQVRELRKLERHPRAGGASEGAGGGRQPARAIRTTARTPVTASAEHPSRTASTAASLVLTECT